MKSYMIPYVVEQTGKGERTYDIYSRLLLDRIVFISGEVNDEMANAVLEETARRVSHKRPALPK